MNRTITSGFLIASCVLISLTLACVSAGNDRPDAAKQLAFASLPPLYEGNSEGASQFSDRVVILAVSPSDCGTCLNILPVLDKIYREKRNRFPIVGIIDTPYRQAAWKFQEYHRLSFPLFYDSSGAIKKQLTGEWKPVLILAKQSKIERFSIVGTPGSTQIVGDILRILVSDE